MTRSPKKEGERYFVQEAAKLLGKEWCLGPDRENPDFILTEDEGRFGLEVVEIFTGPQDGKGAHKKKAESYRQKTVNDFRNEYEAKDSEPLIVKLVGDMCGENMAAVVPTLKAMNLSAKPFGHHEIFDVDEGKAKLSVYVTRALQANWFCVNDRAGPVNQNPVDHIFNAIEDKAKKLPRYKKCTGLDDIRLLVVANRIMNSGKLTLEDEPELDLRGFQVVYFMSYPEMAWAFGGSKAP